MTWDLFWLVLLAMARFPSSASKVDHWFRSSSASLLINFADDGSIEASIFPAHGTGANAISWAPSVLSTASGVSRSQQPSNSLTPQKRFVTAGSDNLIRIWGFDEEQKKWTEEETIKGHEDWVRDVAWAPNIGLPGMYIASASQVSILNVHDIPSLMQLYSGPNRAHPLPTIPLISLDIHSSSPQPSSISRPSFPRCRLAC